MNCPECGYPIPEGKLQCLPCIEKRAWKAALESARPQAAAMAQGQLRLRVLRQGPRFGARHLAIPNHYGSWCGVDLRAFHGKDRAALAEAAQLPQMCEQCMSAIVRFIEVNLGIPAV